MSTTELEPQRGRRFTLEESARGGRQAFLNRQARREEQIERRRILDDLIATWETGEIGTIALASAQEILGQLMEGLTGAEIKSSLDVERYARAADLLFKMHRLATGQSTSNAANLHATVDDPDAARARILAQLQPLAPPDA